VLVRLFKKWFGSVHTAVIVSSILFSALHMQFYGFFPRFALGLILGYTFVWTSSLWIPIIIHFLNNATILMIYYINRTPDISDQEIESIGASQNMFVIIGSAAISCILLYLIYNRKPKVEN
jgi:membrane protease YdiL (CAAX protease family)